MDNTEYIDTEIPWPEFEFQDTEPGSTAVGISGDTPTPLSTLKRYWGYDAFRGIQAEIIDSILAGHDTLGLMPTGGGKSVTFQVPALMMKGTCIVITPLIALMKDQVAHLKERGIKATCLHVGMNHEQILRELDNCILGHYSFLYLSPERLQSQIFLDKLHRIPVSFITVDEAHCISQWGYDFRPSYLEIKKLRQLLPGVPVLGLTATATLEVTKDIVHQLEFAEDAQIFRMSFDRPNLDYRVVKTDQKVLAIIHTLQTTEGCAIVYVRSRAGTRDLALLLQEQGITASYYHAGLSSDEKDVRQQMWQEGRARVMVATNAFGMGIDKADVRLVLHLDPPDSIEAYFQEAGRAGRDGKHADAILFYADSDKHTMLRRIAQNFPEKEKIREIYDDISCYFQQAVGDGMGVHYELDLNDFCRKFRYFPATVEAALQILQRAGYLLYSGEDDSKSRVMFIVRRDDLYERKVHNPVAERVLYTILRNYQGLFSTYVYIDEGFLARECDCTEDEVYDSLLGLTRLRILHYVPRKHKPYVTYTQRRVEHERIVLSPEVYEDRLEQYISRISAVLRYLEDDETPRAEQLLAYFGEEIKPASGKTDGEAIAATLAAKEGAATPAAEKAATIPIEACIGILADGALHHPTDFHALPYPLDTINDALLQLLDMQKATIVNGHFQKK